MSTSCPDESTLNLSCTACRRSKRSSALLKMVRKPEAFLSIMTLKISSSPWALTPLNWFGIEMKRFISLKYRARTSSKGGRNCKRPCLFKRIDCLRKSSHFKSLNNTKEESLCRKERERDGEKGKGEVRAGQLCELRGGVEGGV